MLEPKIFYRKLDSLLSKIGNQNSGKNFLFSIVKEIENTFGKDLCIGNGRIYEEEENNYILISPIKETKDSLISACARCSSVLTKLKRDHQ